MTRTIVLLSMPPWIIYCIVKPTMADNRDFEFDQVEHFQCTSFPEISHFCFIVMV